MSARPSCAFGIRAPRWSRDGQYHDEGEHSTDHVRPIPTDRECDRRDRQAGEQRRDRDRTVLQPERQALTTRVDVASDQDARRAPRERRPHPGQGDEHRQADRGPAHRGDADEGRDVDAATDPQRPFRARPLRDDGQPGRQEGGRGEVGRVDQPQGVDRQPDLCPELHRERAREEHGQDAHRIDGHGDRGRADPRGWPSRHRVERPSSRQRLSNLAAVPPTILSTTAWSSIAALTLPIGSASPMSKG